MEMRSRFCRSAGRRDAFRFLQERRKPRSPRDIRCHNACNPTLHVRRIAMIDSVFMSSSIGFAA
jgi:hypothetical protein